SKTQIIKLANTWIDSAQVSADGQWILFLAIAAKQQKIQLIRLDGQGLQTLYCSVSPSDGTTTLRDVQWSKNQKLVVFDSFTSGPSSEGSFLYLLNMQTEVVQAKISLIGQGYIYPPLTWLDNTRVYLLAPMVDGPSDGLYLLDTNQGATQAPGLLPEVARPSDAFCWNADSSYDGTQLF